jgi:hypothetical protein
MLFVVVPLSFSSVSADFPNKSIPPSVASSSSSLGFSFSRNFATSFLVFAEGRQLIVLWKRQHRFHLRKGGLKPVLD